MDQMDELTPAERRAEKRAAKRRARDEVAAEHPRAMFWVKVGLGIVAGFGVIAQAAGTRAALVEFRCRSASGPIVMTVTQKTTGERGYMPYYSVSC